MEPQLTEQEVRVLGSLVEKQLTTPEYYPLTLNSLTAACNQKTNRDPVVEYSEDDIRDALDSLREKSLSTKLYGPSVRVPKHRHLMDQAWGLSRPALAVMTVLMLRGPQTLAELRNRTERMHEFSDTTEIEAVIARLIERPSGALVMKLGRKPGRREERYAHLLSGIPVDAEPEGTSEPLHSTAGAGLPLSARVADLEHRVDLLQGTLRALEEAFATFRKSFE